MPKPADEMDAALQAILERPEVQDVLDKASGLLDKVAGFLDVVTKRVPRVKPNGKNGHGRKPIPINPRVVLGFGPDEVLTIEKIKERRKKLAAVLHPDLGGSDGAMARLNAATDMLLHKYSQKKE